MDCPNCNFPDMITGSYTALAHEPSSIALHTCTECGYSEIR